MTIAAGTLAEGFSELKGRCGRTYEALSARTGISRSSLHRYCTGLLVPTTFGTVEKIGVACGASKEELDRLYTLWQHARTTAAEHSGQVSASPGLPEAASGDEAQAGQPRSAAPAARASLQADRGRFGRVLAVTAVIAVLLVLAVASATVLGPPSPAPTTAQQITGPAWTLPLAPVPSTLFGVTINSSTGLMPTFKVGAVRLWDSGTRWADLEPEPGTFTWSVLDRLVISARAGDLPILFVLGGTPAWANPTAPAGPYPDGSRAGPPLDLGDWDAYVTALVRRYRGRISAYELWPLANDPRYFTGSIDVLVQMTRHANHIIKNEDPAATVVCPGMGNLWTSAGRQVLRQFAEDRGYDYCDVAGIKLYQRAASDPPETMLALAESVNRLFHESGIQPRVWNTGTTYSITLQAPLTETEARDYAVRFYLVGIYARYLNIERMYFYNWGGRKIPLVLQPAGGAPTLAALGVEQLQHWLLRAQTRSCGHGKSSNLPANAWECDFRITDPDGNHHAAILWTDTGTATVPVGQDADCEHLGGTQTTVHSGSPITVTEEPIFLKYRRPS